MREDIAYVKELFMPLPRVQLGFFPTPLYRLERLSRELGIQLYIKRDDFTGMNLFGGNKIRKLEYLLGEAVQSGARYAITYGATQSNHAMETAAACRQLGISPILYLTAVVPPDAGNLRANLLLDEVLGAEIHIVPIEAGETEADAEKRSFALGAARAAQLNADGEVCVDLPMGGANATGSLGFAWAVLELAEQLEAMGNPPITRLYHATGTGGTMAGLHAGRALTHMDVEIHSVCVSPKDEAAYIDQVLQLSKAVLARLGSALQPSREAMRLDLNHWQPGYEQPSEKASEAIRLLARTEGLFVDPVYTGKALSALISDARGGKINPGEHVLFWHTGGATALFAEAEILGKLCSHHHYSCQ